MIVFLVAQRTNAYNRYAMCPAGNNNKDEDNNPKNLNDKNQQASSQKFRQLAVNSTANATGLEWSTLLTALDSNLHCSEPRQPSTTYNPAANAR